MFVLGSLGGGGTERQVVEILRRIDRSRFTPMLHLIYRSGELLSEIPTDVPVSFFGDRYIRPSLNWPGRLYRAQARQLAGIIRDQRVGVLYDRTIHATLVAAAAARRMKIPRVAVVVNDPQMDLEASGQRFIFIKRRLLRRAYDQASHIVSVSAGVRDSVARYYDLPIHRITTVYNLFDLEALARLAAEPVAALEAGRFHIFAAGRLQRQKGFRFLLEALTELVHRRGREQLLLHIFGQGSDEKSLREMMRSQRLEGNIRFEGYCPNLMPLLKQAHLFCLPSLFEGMPNALVEAIACNVPVLSTNCPSGPSEILGDGQFGCLVPPADALALANGIDDAMQNYDSWQSRVRSARKHVEENFSADVGISRIMNLLDEAASGGTLNDR